MKNPYNSIISMFIFIGLFISGNVQAASQYVLEDLGQVPIEKAKSIQINDHGDYTLPVKNIDNSVEIFLKTGTEQILIKGFGYNGVQLNDLNNNGHAVGHAISDPLTSKVSALYFDGLNSHNIETLESIESTANGINDNNVIVGEIRIDDGSIFLPDNPTRAVIYDTTTLQMQLLDDLLTAQPPFIFPNMATAKSINAKDEITGDAGFFNNCSNSLSGCEAYLFSGDVMTQLGYLATNENDPVISSGERSQGQAVNARGHLAGYSDRIGSVIIIIDSVPVNDPSLVGFNPIPFFPDPYHVFFYDGNEMQDLGTLSKEGVDGFAFVSNMNDSDRIVGYVSILGEQKAYMATPRSGLMDLNELIPVGSEWSQLNVATDINNQDVIVGYGIKNGETHAFKLRPLTAVDKACLHAPAKACEIVQCKVGNVCQ